MRHDWRHPKRKACTGSHEQCFGGIGMSATKECQAAAGSTAPARCHVLCKRSGPCPSHAPSHLVAGEGQHLQALAVVLVLQLSHLGVLRGEACKALGKRLVGGYAWKKQACAAVQHYTSRALAAQP